MNSAFIMKYKIWLPSLLHLVSRLREALWWSKKMYANQHELRNQFVADWEWNEILWLNGKLDRLEYLYKTHLITSLLPYCYSQNLLLWIPSLGLNFQKKQVSHTTNLHYYMYEERKIIFRTFFTTKEKSKIVTSNSLSISISSCKNKTAIRRSILEKNGKNIYHLEIKYSMLEGGLV